MAVLGNEKRVFEYMEGKLETGVTRQSFEAAFRKYQPAAHLQRKVGKQRIRWFFKIADEFLRLRVAAKDAKRQRMLQDYRRGARLIEGTQERMSELLAFVQGFSQVGSASRTGPVARFIFETIAAAQKKLENNLDDTFHDIELNMSMLQGLHRKTEVYEFIIDLQRFVYDQFLKMKQMDKEALIGAALSGVKLFTEQELRGDPQERVPRKVFLAMRHYKKHYQDTGIGRVFPVLKRKEKKQ